MCGTTLDTVNASNRRKRIFNDQFSWSISNTKRITVVTDHIDQISQFNPVDINSDPAQVKGQYVDGIGFHGQGQLHGCTLRYLPVVISVTIL